MSADVKNKALYNAGCFWYNSKGYAPVAQMDRVSDSDSEGRWFESSRAYQQLEAAHNLRT